MVLESAGGAGEVESRPVLASGPLGFGNQNPASRGRSTAQSSHLHLALHQVGPELLSCADDLPLVSQQVDAQVLDVSEGREQTDQRLSVNPSEVSAGELESKAATSHVWLVTCTGQFLYFVKVVFLFLF